MRREDLKPALMIAACIVTLGFILTGLSIVSMRVAYHRAYTEIASSCRRVSLLTVDGAKYVCAPVARIEAPRPGPVPGRAENPAPSAAGNSAPLTGESPAPFILERPTPFTATENPAPLTRL